MTAIQDFFSWLFSAQARTAWFTAAIIFLSMLFSAWVAARVTRRTAAKLIEQRDFELRASAIATLVDAATQAAVWNSLSPQEQILSDRASGQALTRVRLLPVKGSDAAASWAAHQLAELQRASASFGNELAPAVEGFRARLVEWQRSPSRARRGFLNDLANWSTLADTPAAKLAEKQDQWVAEQHRQQFQTPAVESVGDVFAPVASNRSLSDLFAAPPAPVEPAEPTEPAETAESATETSPVAASTEQSYFTSPAATQLLDMPTPLSAALPSTGPLPSALPSDSPAEPKDDDESKGPSIWGGPRTS